MTNLLIIGLALAIMLFCAPEGLTEISAKALALPAFTEQHSIPEPGTPLQGRYAVVNAAPFGNASFHIGDTAIDHGDNFAGMIIERGDTLSTDSATYSQTDLEGDTMENPFLISSLPFSDFGNTCQFEPNYDGICPFDSGARDVVYKYVATSTAEIAISLCAGSDYDSKVYVYENIEGNQIACNDDYCSTPNYPYAFVSFIGSVWFIAGNTYYVVVDGYGLDCGNFTIDIFMPGCSNTNMTPGQYPINVPPSGQFDLTGYINNPTSASISTDVWIMLNVPGYGSYGPLKTFLDIPLAPGQTKSAHINQHVPMYAPLGTYDYIAYCGDYPNGICDSAKFQFTVVPPGASPVPTPGEENSDDWVSEGGWETNEVSAEIPKDFILLDAYPNPFNAVTTINYELPSAAQVKIEIYNLAGQKVETLVDGLVSAGRHQVAWDASRYSSGIYFYQVTAGENVLAKRMTLLK